MNRMKIITFKLSLVALLFLLGGCKNGTSQQEKPAAASSTVQEKEMQKEVITLITPDALEEKMNKGTIQLVDVRTDQEWSQGHLKDAKHFEMNNNNWDAQLSTLDKNEPVYVYCAKGGRSARCAIKLEQAGFTQVYDLSGGITDWKNAGKPIE